MTDPVPEASVLTRSEWRCFHCDEVLTTVEAARMHFGSDELRSPACQIDIAEYRRMEELHQRALAEDTDADRRYRAQAADHQSALIREEEKGYARGLADGLAEAQRAQAALPAPAERSQDPK